MDLTYPERGATAGELPGGYHHLRREVPLGRGDAVFARAADAVLHWRMHRRAGLRVRAAAPVAAPGVDVVLGLGWGPLRVTAPCRVVYVVATPTARGFAYGTLPGHPECGEESFVVHRRGDGRVHLTVTAFSRHAWWAARLAAPLARLAQRYVTRRYGNALQAAVRVTGPGSGAPQA
ncbi:MAG TPA: DUF1990 domain-containing protein [Pilimelia sp.]|nr:DUF1990 domain-containing protein [Pilimelia sp.]